MGCQRSKGKSKFNIPSDSFFVNSSWISTPPALLAWSSSWFNEISVIDMKTKQSYANFRGPMMTHTGLSWTHVKEIPNSKLLVSLHHVSRTSAHRLKSANMEIFDISKKGKANKIYSLQKVYGIVGHGDVTYNSRRSILGAIPVTGRIAYHLFTIDTNASNTKDMIKLSRKSKWHLQSSTHEDNFITGFDFNPAGESIATIDAYGVCLISDVNTNNYGFDLQTGNGYDYTMWIDVCQSNGNLLASSGHDRFIKIFDKRVSKIVKSFEGIHPGSINCVRWSPSGDMIASASSDRTAKLLDFKTGKVLHTGTSNNSAMSVCFI